MGEAGGGTTDGLRTECPRCSLPRPALTAMVHELTEAIRFTVEYTGTEMLPPIEGWSWYDALRKYAPEVADQFLAGYQPPVDRPAKLARWWRRA